MTLLDSIKSLFSGPKDSRDDHPREGAVDHDRAPGVPPEHVDDYADSQEDMESAESFPASDPPANY